jgi:hypothetical protein
MRIHFHDHAGFHRAALHVTVACSALAGLAALAGAERFRPGAAVLAAAVATLAMALQHLRVVLDPISQALAGASTEADASGRALLGRAATAHARIAAGQSSAPADGDAQALVAAAGQATLAVADLICRRQSLMHQLRGIVPADAEVELSDLQRRSDTTADPAARNAYGRAVSSLQDRLSRAAALEGVIDRIDARLRAAVAELESTALAVATRAELEPGDAPALAAACDRLRSANADLNAEWQARAEVGAVCGKA